MCDEVSNVVVSIIVPVYNVEQYISDCANSILSQSYGDIEVIFINDGSWDASGRILDEIASKDSRVKIIHKENGGVSQARNLGLDSATGDFVMFIDSDDWIDVDMVQEMLGVALSESAEIVSCGMRYIDMSGGTRINSHGTHPMRKRLDTRELILEVINEFTYGGGSLCCRLIDRNLTDTIRFIESMRVSEDQEWLFRVAQVARSMIYIPEALYNVRVRSNSATTKSRLSDVEDIETVNSEVLLWANRNGFASSATVLNALYVRARLQYSSAARADAGRDILSGLRVKMTESYCKTVHIHRAEKIKYYISLLPPGLYLSTRTWLKRMRNESK